MYQNLNGKLTSTGGVFSKDIMKLVRFHTIVQITVCELLILNLAAIFLRVQIILQKILGISMVITKVV